jgi:hypothetical protein
MSLYAINGKEPIAAWIPSRDDAGNGTTTLTDLVGSNDGTLTNMDAATDWVLDDGKYALDFDGVNDYVDIGGGWGTLVGRVAITATAWLKAVAVNKRQAVLGDWNSSGGNESFVVELNNFQRAGGSVRNPLLMRYSAGTILAATWTHLAWVASAAGTRFYTNGVLTDTTATAIDLGGGTHAAIARAGAFDGIYFDGRLDDIRIFDQALDDTDIADLHAAGRGGITNPPATHYFTGIRSYNRRRKVGT